MGSFCLAHGKLSLEENTFLRHGKLFQAGQTFLEEKVFAKTVKPLETFA